MKTILIVAGLVLSALFCNAQNAGDIKPGEEVKFDWNDYSLFSFEEFWDATYAKIVREVGEEKAKSIKEYSSFKRWPSGTSSTGTDSASVKAHKAMLSKLRVLKVMSLTYELNGKIHKIEILEVPYHLNKDWNPGVKWEYMFVFTAPEHVKK